MSGLGYLGADIVLDRKKGPLVLELNARPGLAIQIANGMGMLPRLKAIEAMDRRRTASIEDRVEYVKAHFSD
jgi:glutathione synthase/RimK-type ligase-like ATP-grasp enzyme